MSKSKNPYNAVMFDLDGTLADTLADIAAAANFALTSLGHNTIDLPDYRYLAGQGLEYLITHALGQVTETKPQSISHEQIQAGMDQFKFFYKDHSLDQTKPFDGIADVLNKLNARQIPVCILSNKPHHATCDVVQKIFGQWTFAHVLGHVEGAPLKPDPTTAIELAGKMSVAPDTMLYVGDTSADMQTAKAAGFFAVGVLWGFRDEPELRESGADAIVNHPIELLDVLDGKL